MNKYKEFMDHIYVTEEMKEEILKNIEAYFKKEKVSEIPVTTSQKLNVEKNRNFCHRTSYFRRSQYLKNH